MLHRPGVYPHHHLLRAPYRSLLRSDHRNGRGSSSQVNLAHSCLVATCFVSIRLPAHTHTQGAYAAQSSSSLLLGTHPGFAARTASRTTKANSPQSASSNLQPQGFKTSCPGLSFRLLFVFAPHPVVPSSRYSVSRSITCRSQPRTIPVEYTHSVIPSSLSGIAPYRNASHRITSHHLASPRIGFAAHTHFTRNPTTTALQHHYYHRQSLHHYTTTTTSIPQSGFVESPTTSRTCMSPLEIPFFAPHPDELPLRQRRQRHLNHLHHKSHRLRLICTSAPR